MPTLTANGIEMYYERLGVGEPLTLIMGLACSARQWKWMAEGLAQHFELILFDNRGVGRTDKPLDEYTTEQMADDTAALLTELGIESTHLVGVSMGGMVAQQFALKYPARLRSLVLSCTMPSFGSLPPTDEDIATMAVAGSPEVSHEDGVASMQALFLTPGFRERQPQRTAEMRQIMITEREEQGPDAFMFQFGAMAGHAVDEGVSGIQAPTLVIGGDLDPVVPLANARFLAEHIPGSQLKVYEGCQHALWTEEADRAVEDVVGFIRGL